MAEPMYWRIAQDLRHDIEGGELRPGQQLPTEQELREKYGASRNTVRDAMKWLMSRALIDSRPGQGTFVAEQPDAFLTTLSPISGPGSECGGGEGVAAQREISARGHEARWDTPRVDLQSADDHVAEQLGVATGTLIVSRHQRRYIDGAPWSLQTSFFPMDLVTRGAQRLLVAKDLTEGTVAYLREALGLIQVGYSDRILVRPPDQDEVAFFGLPDDGRIAVTVINRTAYTASADGLVPFRVTVSVFPADRNQFVSNSGLVPHHLAGPVRPPDVTLSHAE